jgi:hypothetical protein
MVQKVAPVIDKRDVRRTFERLTAYLRDQNALPPEHIQFLTDLYAGYEQAVRYATAMEAYGSEMEAWAKGEAPKRKHPIRPKPPTLSPYGIQRLEYNAPYARSQLKIRYEYVCAECGQPCVHDMIPSPFKPKYCLREDGTESDCQRAARLRRLREYNAARAQKAGNR